MERTEAREVFGKKRGRRVSIAFEHITKEYKKKTAVDDVSFVLSEGIYGLLGPNGAGKSTLMKMLVGNLQPTAGIITYDGTDIRRMGADYRRLIGYMPQQQEVYPYFTGRRFLLYMASLKGIGKQDIRAHIEELAEKVNLSDVLDKKIGSYSGGMRQRLLIAQALLGNPRVLVFDEPTAGLDPKERIRVRNLISENSAGKSVLIATHVVQDIEFIATRILMLRQGKMVDQGEPDVLVEKISGHVWETDVPLPEAHGYMEGKEISNIMRMDGRARIRLIAEKQPDDQAREVSPDLEDYYLYTYSDRRTEDV